MKTNKLVTVMIRVLILLFAILFVNINLIAQKQILRLDDTKSNELYFLNLNKDRYLNFYINNEDAYCKRTIDSNSLALKKPVYYHSKKAGISFNLDTNFNYFVDDQALIRKFYKFGIMEKQ
jgi:hypothetical protein